MPVSEFFVSKRLRASWGVWCLLGLVWTVQAQAGLPVQHWTQASGARIYLVESPAIPMLDVQIDFDAGSRRDPEGQAGLAAMTAALTAKGVRATTTEPALDENALSEAWVDLGASLAPQASSDRLSFALRSLTDPELLARAATLAARQIGEPAWPAAVWARERERVIAAQREADTRPATQAQRAFQQAVYGAHPYGREATAETLQRITPADMARHHQLLLPCRARVSLVGAVNRAQADQLVTTLLSRLPTSGACPALPAVPEVPALTEAASRRIPFQAAQAQVLLGQPGITRRDPDYFPITVGNYILGGGGFVSRLMHEVREKRGLSYSVYSYFAPAAHAGAFTVGLQTRPDQADQALAVAEATVQRFVADGPTDDELKAAKDFLVGGFALRLDSNRKLLDNLASIAWNDLPLNYLDTWTDAVHAVTSADIRRAFQRVLQPERMVRVVVGGVAADLSAK